MRETRFPVIFVSFYLFFLSFFPFLPLMSLFHVCSLFPPRSILISICLYIYFHLFAGEYDDHNVYFIRWNNKYCYMIENVNEKKKKNNMNVSVRWMAFSTATASFPKYVKIVNSKTFRSITCGSFITDEGEKEECIIILCHHTSK